jgi:hypothetical protein
MKSHGGMMSTQEDFSFVHQSSLHSSGSKQEAGGTGEGNNKFDFA